MITKEVVKLYIALIGDIIASKQIVDRDTAQKKLYTLLDKINIKYKEQLYSPFTITAGDEFQALFIPNTYIFQIIDEISLAFMPYEIRFGIGAGTMLTKIDRTISIGSDGPAYWQARKAINFIHSNNDYGMNKIAVSIENKVTEEVINTILSACAFIQSKWIKTQQIILKQLIIENNYSEYFSNKNLAKSLGISPSAFNKRLKTSGIKIYLRNKNIAMNMLLNETREK